MLLLCSLSIVFMRIIIIIIIIVTIIICYMYTIYIYIYTYHKGRALGLEAAQPAGLLEARLGIHHRGVQWEGGAVGLGCII